MFLEKSFFFPYFFLYILVNKKKKKIPDRPSGRFFGPPGGQETIYHLRLALSLNAAAFWLQPGVMNFDVFPKGFANVERIFARNTRQGNRYNF